MFWLNFLRGFIQTLNEDTSPNEVAAGFAIGMLLGFLPKVAFLALCFWAFFFMVRVNKSMGLAAAFVFTGIGAVTDPWAERLGYFLLTGVPGLAPFWTYLYNLPVVPWTAFNNTLVLGNLIIGLVLWAPTFLCARKGLGIYRERYRDRVRQSKLAKALSASQWVNTWQRWVNH